jgi:hypothetical protein
MSELREAIESELENERLKEAHELLWGVMHHFVVQGNGVQGPGHCHKTPGVYDFGGECEWCATWQKVLDYFGSLPIGTQTLEVVSRFNSNLSAEKKWLGELSSLQAENERLQEFMDFIRKEFPPIDTMPDTRMETIFHQNKILRERVGELEAALLAYGSHSFKDGKHPICEASKHSDYPCTCGFQQALATQAGKVDVV